MINGRPYSYSILRYVHDVATGEFINVGVIVHVPSSAHVQLRVRRTIGRLRRAFPDMDREAFIRAMSAVERGAAKLQGALRSEGTLISEGNAIDLGRRILPEDDSSLRWSMPGGSGLTADPAETLARLFERFVSRYDVQPVRGRTDEDIWRPVRQKLVERDLVPRLQEKRISGAVDDIVFKHAWKNGVWHVYEALSFDLADADGIKAKAREWRGHLSAVADGAKEDFKPHFIVGAPERPGLQAAYTSALGILKHASVNPEIFEESQVDDLVAQIEDEIRADDAVGRG